MTSWFDKISYSVGAQELIDQKYLVPPKLHQILRESNELDDICAHIVTTYQKCENGKNGIIFMKRIEDAETIRNIFEKKGIRAEAITSRTNEQDRHRIFKAYNNGDIKILSTVDVLSAGFDSARVESIFLPYAIGSTTQYVQRVGRGLRTHDESGKKLCNIYVYGDAPTLSNGVYEKLQERSLNVNGPIKEYDTFKEELDYNDFDE